MNVKALIPVVAGLCIGGFALKLVFDTVKKAKGAQDTTVAVWSPAMEIERGSVINEPMLTSMNFPAKSIPEGAITKKEDAIGRVARIAAPAGLPILDSMLLPRGTIPGIQVKPGFRAVSIKVDESSGVSNLLQPGAIVDVIGYFSVRRTGKEEIVSRTLIENVEVGAVGQRFTSTNEKSEKEEKERGGPSQAARSVTLFVKPEDVPQIHLAEQRGKLKLSLRNDGDFVKAEKSDLVTESKVVGVNEEEEASLASKLKNLLSPAKPADPPPAPSATLPTEPEQVKLAHQMVVWNGPDRLVMGWKTLDSMDAIELEHDSSKSHKSSNNKSGLPHATQSPDSVGGSPATSAPQNGGPINQAGPAQNQVSPTPNDSEIQEPEAPEPEAEISE